MRLRATSFLPALLAAGLLLAGCGSDGSTPEAASGSPSSSSSSSSGDSESAEPTTAQAETDRCYTAADDDGPDFTTAVDCSQPHVGEVFAVLELPAGSPTDRAEYESGPAADEWSSWADLACAEALSEASGGAALAPAVQVTKALVMPDWRATYSYSLTPVDEWDAGIQKTVCTSRPGDGEPLAGEWVPTAFTADRPDELALCFFTNGKSTKDVSCDQPHFQELSFRFDGSVELGPEFIKGIDPNQPTDDQYATMDAYCARGEEPLVGALRDDLKVYSYVDPAIWGQNGYHFVSCSLQPEATDKDVVGSVLQVGDGPLEFVPAQG